MNQRASRRLAGLGLIIVPLVFTLCFVLLGSQFEYPDILRQPTADVLAKFQAGGTPLLATWYVLTLTAVTFIPLAVLVHMVIAQEHPPAWLGLVTAMGVVAGLVQALGFIRWPFLVPHLASIYLDPAAGEAARTAAAIVFEGFHRYAGMAIGEHLGYLFTALWTVLIAIAMRRANILRPWLAWVGVVLGAGVAVGLLEPTGVEVAGTVNAISYLLWSAWLVVVGAVLLAHRAPEMVPESVPFAQPK